MRQYSKKTELNKINRTWHFNAMALNFFSGSGTHQMKLPSAYKDLQKFCYIKLKFCEIKRVQVV